MAPLSFFKVELSKYLFDQITFSVRWQSGGTQPTPLGVPALVHWHFLSAARAWLSTGDGDRSLARVSACQGPTAHCGEGVRDRGVRPS